MVVISESVTMKREANIVFHFARSGRGKASRLYCGKLSSCEESMWGLVLYLEEGVSDGKETHHAEERNGVDAGQHTDIAVHEVLLSRREWQCDKRWDRCTIDEQTVRKARMM